MNFRKQKTVYIGIAVMELIVVLFCILHGTFKERMEASYGDAYDEPVPSADYAIELERGTYTLKLSYQIDSGNVTCQAVVDTSYGTVDGDPIPLHKEQSSKTFELEVKEHTDSFYIQINAPEEAQVGVTELELKENSRMDRAFSFTLAVVFLLLDLLLYLKNKKIWENLSSEKKNTCAGLAVITILAVVPLLVNYLTRGHDFRFHMIRIGGIAKALSMGQFPVRMQPLWLNDYGYPVSVMYGDLFLYVPALLYLAGYTLRTAYKIYLVLVTAATVWTSYYCVKNITNSYKTGLLGSFLYTMSFYRITNVYVRNSVGEYTAMAFMPLIFLALYRLFHTEKTEKRKYAVLLMIGYTGILQSHILSSEMIIVFSIFYCILSGQAFLKNFWTLVKTGIVTVLLNLSFLLPFFDYMISQEMQLDNGTTGSMQEHGIFLTQLFQVFSFGSYISDSVDKGMAGDMPLGIGISLVIALFVYLWQYLCYKKQLKENTQEAAWKEQGRICILMIVSIVMSCWFFPWHLLENISGAGQYLTPYQFPWRFLAIATVFGVFLAGYAVTDLERTVGAAAKKTVILVICIFTGISACSIYDRVMANYSAELITSGACFDSILATAGGEYLLEGADRYRCYDTSVVPDEDVAIKDYNKDGCSILLSCENGQSEERQIIVPLFAYKGFTAKDTETGEKLEVFAEEDTMRLGVVVPAGYTGEIKIYFREPWLWRVAELISLLTIIFLIWLIAGGKWNSKCRII